MKEPPKKISFIPISKLWLLVLVLFISNSLLAFLIIFKNKENPSFPKENQSNIQYQQVLDSSMINSTCPDIDMLNSQGQLINLTNFVGDVIVLRTTRFHPQDIPYLLYLEHLYNKYKENGLHLFFIHLLGKDNSVFSKPFIDSTIPIIDDDGFIASVFLARLNETIIIDRDFKIKFKHNNVSNRTIYNQIRKYLFTDESIPFELSNDELGSIISNLMFKDVKSSKLIKIKDTFKENKTLLTLFISQCFSCPENKRITFIKQIAENLGSQNKKVILMFGQGNDFNSILEFSKEKQLLNSLDVGIIHSSEFSNEKYYQIFLLDRDPRSFIFNEEGKIIFSEPANLPEETNLQKIRKIMAQ